MALEESQTRCQCENHPNPRNTSGNYSKSETGSREMRLPPCETAQYERFVAQCCLLKVVLLAARSNWYAVCPKAAQTITVSD